MEIPRDRVQLTFARSGGPGGQNVNKVATAVELRFVPAEADWIPAAVRARLVEATRARLTHAGELIVRSSRHRTQSQNVEDCFEKLAALLDHAAHPPAQRRATRPTRASRKRRLEGKARDAERKSNRRWRAGD